MNSMQKQKGNVNRELESLKVHQQKILKWKIEEEGGGGEGEGGGRGEGGRTSSIPMGQFQNF
jgi:hypothetical protein